MTPLVKRDSRNRLARTLHPLSDSGRLPASLATASLNVLFIGSDTVSRSDARNAALAAEGSH